MKKINLKNSPDFYFACGIFYMQAVLSDTEKYANYFLEIEKSHLKCLEIGENKNNEGVAGCGSFKASYNLEVFYEVTGNTAKAKQYYQLSARQGYEQAAERLKKYKIQIKSEYFVILYSIFIFIYFNFTIDIFRNCFLFVLICFLRSSLIYLLMFFFVLKNKNYLSEFYNQINLIWDLNSNRN